MKTYKDYPKIDLGYSDIATLIAVGTMSWDELREKSKNDPACSCLKIGEVGYGGDNIYDAYLVTDKNVEIGAHYEKVFECESWLKIYDDDTCVFKSDYKYNHFEIYRAANYGTIIKCWNSKQ